MHNVAQVRPILPEKTCAAENCEKKFTPKRVNQVYHEPSCATRARRHVRVPATLDDALDSTHTRDIERANAAELKKTLAWESRMRRYISVLESTLGQYEPTPLVLTEPPSDRHKPTHEWIAVLGDWHTGQKTRIEETGGIYYQDVETTRRQVEKVWRAIEWLHRIESSGRRIDVMHNIVLGDLVDNDQMRPSQARHVEDVFTVQTVQAFDLLVWLIRQELTIFERVEVDLVGGNHDRTSPKRGDGGLAELDYIDTVAWLLGEFLKRTLAADIASGRLKVRNWQTFFGYKQVANLRVVFEHGASFKWSAQSYGGVPWYSIQTLGARYGQMLGEPDLVLVGHGHKPAVIPTGRGWIVVNGAFPATSTYVQSSFKTVQRPQQWLISTHRELGVTGILPLYADVEGTVKPGEIWADTERYAVLANPDRVGG